MPISVFNEIQSRLAEIEGRAANLIPTDRESMVEAAFQDTPNPALTGVTMESGGFVIVRDGVITETHSGDGAVDLADGVPDAQPSDGEDEPKAQEPVSEYRRRRRERALFALQGLEFAADALGSFLDNEVPAADHAARYKLRGFLGLVALTADAVGEAFE